MPVPPSSWKVEHWRPQGDDLVRPTPTGRLGWEEPEGDVGGFPERIRFFAVYGSDDPNLVQEQSPAALLDETFSDADPLEPGFQYYIYDNLEIPRYYTVVPVDMAGNRGEAAPMMSPQIPVSSVPDMPVGTVSQNYPNPFNPKTNIDFALAGSERVRISVFDPAGKLVKVLTNQVYGAGTWTVSWDGKSKNDQDVASGVYFMKLDSATLSDSKKMVLVR